MTPNDRIEITGLDRNEPASAFDPADAGETYGDEDL